MSDHAEQLRADLAAIARLHAEAAAAVALRARLQAIVAEIEQDAGRDSEQLICRVLLLALGGCGAL